MTSKPRARNMLVVGAVAATVSATAWAQGTTSLANAFSELQASIRDALRWLVAHRDDDGRWDCAGFSKHDAKRVRRRGTAWRSGGAWR